MSELHGYGICTDDIIRAKDSNQVIKNEKDIEPLKNLIRMAPKFAEDHVMATLEAMEHEIPEMGVNLAWVGSELMYRVFGDDAGMTGLSYILSLVIAECENVHLTAILDDDGYEYLMFAKRYPWQMNETEKALTEEDLARIFRKYSNVLQGHYATLGAITIYQDE